MTDLTHFIGQNLLSSLVFIGAVFVYVIFEISQLKAQSYRISIQDAISLSNRKKGVFMDIRDDNQYAKGHIVGAINATIKQLKAGTKFLKKYQASPIIVYCDNENQAQTAYQLLKNNQFTTHVLKGGFKQWQSEKLPIERNAK